ncbi:MAG: MaoC family dehydratase N-terminal domain-containing protein [Pseudomonadota bacterium]
MPVTERMPEDWTNRRQILTDPMSPWPAQAFCRVLELTRAEPGPDDPLPPFWHWMYFLEARPRSALGLDGHPAVGGFIPEVAQPRRMWAGGRLQIHGALPLGREATKTSTIANVAEKTGRAGAMTFVTVRHEITGGTGLAITEEQDIVYRDDPDPNAPKRAPKQAPTDETHAREWSCDSTVLFRYSALTFNGHKIHYDLDHATRIEGYPGLVVHGPLLATLLLELAQEIGPVSEFSYRLTAPIFADEPFTICAKETDTGLTLWARGPDGRLAIEGSSQ